MSSKRAVRRKACGGKVRYSTEHAAVCAMIKISSLGLAVYKCPFCGSYHVGHMNKRQRKGRYA